MTTTAVSISILDPKDGGPAVTNKGSRTALRVQPMSINIARTIDRDYIHWILQGGGIPCCVVDTHVVKYNAGLLICDIHH